MTWIPKMSLEKLKRCDSSWCDSQAWELCRVQLELTMAATGISWRRWPRRLRKHGFFCHRENIGKFRGFHSLEASGTWIFPRVVFHIIPTWGLPWICWYGVYVQFLNMNMLSCQSCLFECSKKTPTDPWNIPQTLNYKFMKEILSHLYFEVPGVCSRGLLEFSFCDGFWNFPKVHRVESFSQMRDEVTTPLPVKADTPTMLLVTKALCSKTYPRDHTCLGRIKQCKTMVNLLDFPLIVHCLGW